MVSREDSPHREAPNKQTRGTKKYKEWIDRESRQLDKFGNLPFTFGKPAKKTQARRDVLFQCGCGLITAVSKNTCGIECGKCKKYQSITAANILTEEQLEQTDE